MHVVCNLYSEEEYAKVPRRPGARSENEFRRDGAKLDVRAAQVWHQGEIVNEARFHTVVNSNYSLMWQFNPQFAEGPTWASGSDGPSNIFGVALSQRSSGLALDGLVLFCGAERLAKILSGAGDVHVQGREEIDGRRCEIVAGTTEYGAISLWIAPTAGHLPMKSLCKKGPGDRPHADELGFGFGKGVVRNAWACTVEIKQVLVCQGTYVPVKGLATETWDLDNGKHGEVISEIERTRITLGPPAGKGLFEMKDLPEDAEVIHEGHKGSGLRYMWRHGKIWPRPPNRGK
jgi:hypothetical protein